MASYQWGGTSNVELEPLNGSTTTPSFLRKKWGMGAAALLALAGLGYDAASWHRGRASSSDGTDPLGHPSPKKSKSSKVEKHGRGAPGPAPLFDDQDR
jgi:hypothetical protein